jgi:hypothetical protein
MARTLRVMCKGGFQRDTIVVRIDGREVARKDSISTRTDVEPPLAWSADVPISSDRVDVEVSVPTRNASGTLQVDVTRSPQVDVSLLGDRIAMRGSEIVPTIG